MNNITATVLMSLLLLALRGINANQMDIFLVNTNHQMLQCLALNSTCLTLEDLFTYNQFESNTNLILLPGKYIVDRNDSRVYVQNAENFSVIGWTSYEHNSKSYSGFQFDNTNYTTIECTIGTFAVHFYNVVNIVMSGLRITNCNPYNLPNMIIIPIQDSLNIAISDVQVSNGTGTALSLYNVFGIVNISNSLFVNNTQNCYIRVSYEIGEEPFANIYILNSEFSGGFISLGSKSSGISIITPVLSRGTVYVTIFLSNVSLHCNYAPGGNLYIAINSNYVAANITIHRLMSTYDSCTHPNSHLTDTNDYIGLYLELFLFQSSATSSVIVSESGFSRSRLFFTQHSREWDVKFKSLHFQNVWTDEHSVIKLRNVKRTILEDITIINSGMSILQMDHSSDVIFRGHNLFANNQGGVQVAGLSNLTLDRNSTTKIQNNICTNAGMQQSTSLRICSTLYVRSSKIQTLENSFILFQNNTALISGGITLHESSIFFQESATMVFKDNHGTNGGALSLYTRSKLTFCFVTTFRKPCGNGYNITILFIGNHAEEHGGAMYVEDLSGYVDILSGELQEQFLGQKQCKCKNEGTYERTNNVTLMFTNNTSNIAGSAVYGGWIDLQYYANEGRNIFDTRQQHDLSEISSRAIHICECMESIPNCTVVMNTREIYRGQTIEIQAVAVGQRLGTVPSVVHANYKTTNFQAITSSTLDSDEYVQTVTGNCTTLRYTVFSVYRNELLELTTNNRLIPHTLLNALSPKLYWTRILLLDYSLQVTLFEDCPAGFALNEDKNKCVCHPILIDGGIDNCDINTLEIQKPVNMWINATTQHSTGNNTSGVLVHKHCPFDYCLTSSDNVTSFITVKMEQPDKQCAHNRSGILCGTCDTNLSHVLGSSRCKRCSSLWVLLIFPSAALAGLALVVFLICLNMTVSIGAINGLIFYASIVRANHAIFFPSNTVLSTFIAWLNLDLGVEVCLYNGLNAYVRTWLQFCFPLCIWLIIIIIIISSRHSTKIARLCGTNAVSVLATLFLLSYTKLLRLFITVFQSTVLVYPDGYRRRVWLYDGNVDYLKGKHIPLFLAALLLLVILSIPYTTSLIFIQCLRRINHLKILFWVRKFKPLFDAHTGPYKDKHGYWTGLLLLIRAVLLMVFTLKGQSGDENNLLSIGITILCLLACLSLTGGVYKSRVVNAVEVFSYFNIGLLSIGTYFYKSSPAPKITSISVSLAICSFVFITLYHVYLMMTTSMKRGLGRVKAALKSKVESNRVISNFINPNPTNTKTSHSSIRLRETLLDEVVR